MALTTDTSVTSATSSGATVESYYARRNMNIYPVAEHELDSIQTMNMLTTVLFSVGTGLVSIGIGVLATYAFTDKTGKICAVDFHGAREFAGGLNLSGHRFAEFVAQHERGHVGHVEIAPELQSRDAFNRVDENRDSREILANRHFTRMK